jgi:hypothetical protein
MNPNLTFTPQHPVEFALTIDQLAKAIAHLCSDEQAELISKIAEHACYCVPMQLQAVTDDPGLTTEGRHLMGLIGDYAQRQP